MHSILTTALTVLHVLVCAFLILVVLLQQGKGGGMGAAFGGGTQQVFGGRGAGNLLTRATSIAATIFMLTSVSLAYESSSGDRDLKARAEEKKKQKKMEEGTPRTDAPDTKTETKPAGDKPTETKPADPTPAPTPSPNP
jgi:preprotein translocase subunit SecG